MKTFLHEVAEDLYARYGEGLSERAILFPSRRARLFFVDALTGIAGRPMWQPRWVTVDDLTTEISGLRTGDRVRLITELYKIYSEYHAEPFDKFYFWGDMLLTDFDTIDKYRIDAAMLFRNISEIKEIEADISYLTPAQLQILRFWSTLADETDLSEEKRRFLAIWKTLGPVYARFRERLSELGIAYNGMVQRAAADRIRGEGYAFPEARQYVVAGFNALSECEKQLFRFLSTAAETDFYWDYDSYYKDRPEQEAGMFVRENVVQFPPRGDVSHDNMERPKELTAVAAVSNAVQCKHAAAILRELAARGPLDKRTAVVLTDENLLLPLLYALPPEIGKVNVTMGYPLRASLAYTFVERLVELQAHRRTKGAGCTFYHADAVGILAHPYVADSDARETRAMQDEIVRERRISVDAAWLGRNDLLRMIFFARRRVARAVRLAAAGRRRRGPDALRGRRPASARGVSGRDFGGDFQTPQFAGRVRHRVDDGGLHLAAASPFADRAHPLRGRAARRGAGHGHPRNPQPRFRKRRSALDERRQLPGQPHGAGVVRALQPAGGLRTAHARAPRGVYAYYFYRLVQRARRVWMLYCSHADDKSTGEPSRYIYQLDYESGFPVRKVEVGVDVNLAETDPIEVAKDEGIMQRLGRFTDPESKATLSPTAFFRYVACPLRFYFHSVARLQADDEIAEEVDAPMFGTILHAAVQKLYARIVGEAHPGETLRAMIRTGEIAAAVEAAINENYLQDPAATTDDYTGNLLLVKDIVTRYLRGGVMPYDAAHDGFTVTGLEQEVAYGFDFTAAGRPFA